MSLNIDSRGAARGRCTKCDCSRYTRLVNEGGLRCARCDHCPGEHEREDRMEVDASPEEICSRNGCTNAVHHDPQLPSHLPRFKYCSPECRSMDMLEQELWGALNNSQGSKSYRYSNPSQCHSSTSSSHDTVEKQVFPKCAVHSCSNQVFIDTSLPDHTQQMFKYCSRKCRDADLAMHSDIAEEIMGMEKRLFNSVSDDSLSVYIAGNPKAPCRSCEESMTYSREREIHHTEELPDCLAKGCRRKVFVDKSIEDPTQQRFQYCSKKCRDLSICSDIDEEIAQKERLLFGSVSDSNVAAYIAGNPKGPCRSCFDYKADTKTTRSSSKSSKHEVTKEERSIKISKKSLLQDLGIVLKQTPPSAKIKGCIVVGFERFAYLSLLEGNDISIGFFDVILSVNDIPVDKPAKLQSVSNGWKHINLRYQRLGIPVNQEILSKVTGYNYIFGIKWTSKSPIKLVFRNRGYQISLEVQTDSPVYCNGLRDQDIVKGHVVVSDVIDVKDVIVHSDDYHVQANKFERAIEKAKRDKLTLILYIYRFKSIV